MMMMMIMIMKKKKKKVVWVEVKWRRAESGWGKKLSVLLTDC